MLIVIEGIDGSGKATQAKMLVERLEALDIATHYMTFPGYSKTYFGAEVGNYLNGMYGNLSSVEPKFASLLYALDRFEQKEELCTALFQEKVVVCDRYVSSNIGHQASKYPEAGEKKRMIEWISHVEYNILRLPSPEITFLLNIDPAYSAQLVGQKAGRDYTSKKHDLHESDSEYLYGCSDTYRMAAEILPNWKVIDYGKGLPAVEDIADRIWEVVKDRLTRKRNFHRGGPTGVPL